MTLPIIKTENYLLITSDEEIEEASLEAPFKNSFKMGAKWYREQLKKK